MPHRPPLETISFVATDTEAAQDSLRLLKHRYGNAPPEQAEVIVALGGDGFMLETLHRFLTLNRPIYGMNRGTVGFLMNGFDAEDLPRRLARAASVTLHPLRMTASTVAGVSHDALAFNEVSLLRETRQAAKLRITVDQRVRIDELICDGALVCTAAGSTAYNLSAHGPILPMGSNVMALTAMSAFRPRRWRGAILPSTARVIFDVSEHAKRPVSAVADFTEVRDVIRVEVHEDRSVHQAILFDPEHNLEERILAEQFSA